MNIELFSGIGCSLDGAIRIDIDPKMKPDIVADVRFLPLRPGLRPEHLHGSPPCKYFSVARQRRYGLDPEGIAESFELVAAFFHAVDYLEPKHWTLETPANGLLARILRERKVEYAAHDYKHKTTNFYSDLRAMKRGMIPKEVMESFLP